MQMCRGLADTTASGKGQPPVGQEELLEDAAFLGRGTRAVRTPLARARRARSWAPGRAGPCGSARVAALEKNESNYAFIR